MYSVSILCVLLLYAIVCMLVYESNTLRDILKANGSLLKFYSVILCDTLVTIDTVGQDLIGFIRECRAEPTGNGLAGSKTVRR